MSEPRVAEFFPRENAVRSLKDAMNHPDPAKRFPAPPPWRDFARLRDKPERTAELENEARGGGLVVDGDVVDAVNAALILRRPLLLTGKPGTGKSSLAYAVAHRLKLGRVLVWPITSRSTLKQGLYEYDAVARLENASRRYYEQKEEPKEEKKPGEQGGKPKSRRRGIGRYIRLGPVGTALLPGPLPRVLLIDEIDKSDVDLPNDLLHVFEEGKFRIDELARLPKQIESVKVFPHDCDDRVDVAREGVACTAFPFVILTSNEEREFPPAFNRRCIRLRINEPDEGGLADIVRRRLYAGAEGADLDAWRKAPENAEVGNLIKLFHDLRKGGPELTERREQAVDQLLNAAHLLLNGYLEAKTADPKDEASRGWKLRDLIFTSLTGAGGKVEGKS